MGTTADKLKGKLKKKEGELTDDKIRQGQGWAEEKAAEVKEGAERAADRVDEKIDEIRRDRRDDDERPVR
jgi:uncharacterized protein YjbJ (UPF0337 family)